MEVPDYSEFEQSAPSSGDLQNLSALAHEMYLAELRVLDVAEELKKTQEQVRKISEDLIPELMKEIGIAEFTTHAGVKLCVKDVLRASIPVARRSEAYKWLNDNGHGDLIKRNITVGFGRGEGDEALELLEDLDAKGLRVKDEEKIEPSTLKKFVGDQLKEGNMIPLDLFGAYQFKQAKITARPETAFGD
jgi:SpoVK/Ycf46/Vps4 family AAA+-type ATPase